MEKRLRWLAAFALLGAIISAYSLWHHYGDGEGWCNLSVTLNCDIVNRGPYAEIAGIPVSLIGLIGYVGISAVALLAYKKQTERRELVRLLKIALAGAFLFSLYLTYLEAFVLHVYCPACLASLAIVIVSCLLICFPAPPRDQAPSSNTNI